MLAQKSVKVIKHLSHLSPSSREGDIWPLAAIFSHILAADVMVWCAWTLGGSVQAGAEAGGNEQAAKPVSILREKLSNISAGDAAAEGTQTPKNPLLL